MKNTLLKRLPLIRHLSISVNKEEVNKFESIGMRWWDRDTSAGSGPLHDMNICRINFIREQLAGRTGTLSKAPTVQLDGLKILDVGCGGGLVSESLARLGADVTAIDPSPTNIEIASRHSSHDPTTSSIVYKNTTVEEIASSGRKFDAVVSLEVLEHVESPLSFLAACSNCLNPGGSLFLSTINRTPKSFAITIAAGEYVLGVLPIGTHSWQKFIRPEELKTMLGNQLVGVSSECVAGMVMRPCCKGLSPSVEWTLSPNDFDVNYILHGVKL